MKPALRTFCVLPALLSPALLLVGLALVACRPSALPASDAVARVGTEDIHYRQFEDYMTTNVGPGGRSLAPKTLTRIFDQFLDEEILVRHAIDSGLVPGGTPNRVAVEAILGRVQPAEIRPEEIEAYYEKHRERFERPEQIRLRQILVEDRATAVQALAALEAGEDFGDVARRLSTDPNAPRGGDQGELARADLPPVFVDVVFGLKAGETSPIVEAEYGYHVFQVVERKSGATVPLADAEAEIRQLLHQRRADRVMRQVLAEARSRYNVQVYERNLPFDYRGVYRVPNSSPG